MSCLAVELPSVLARLQEVLRSLLLLSAIGSIVHENELIEVSSSTLVLVATWSLENSGPGLLAEPHLLS